MSRRFSDLSLAWKLSFLVMPLALPLVLLLWLYVSEKQISIDFAEKERIGLDVLDPLVQAYAGAVTGKPRPDALQAAAIPALELGLADRMKNTALTGMDFLELAALVGDRSNLILDPDLDTYYLMDIVLLRLPAHLAALVQIVHADKDRIAAERILAAERIAGIRTSLERARAANGSLAGLSTHVEAFEKTSASFLEDPDRSNLAPAIQGTLRLYEGVSGSLRSLLEHRINGFVWKRNEALIAVAVLFLVAAGAGIVIARSIRRPLEEVVVRVEELSQGTGDLTLRLNELRGRESRRLAAGVNAFMQHLSGTISRLRHHSSGVSEAATKLSGSAGILAGSISNQAAASEEAAAALEEITASFDAIALSTEQAASEILAIQSLIGAVDNSSARASRSLAGLVALSNEAAERSKLGQQVVEKTRGAMSQIHSSSEQISSILAIINSVSDQIDLLALNASIEAARAGDAGRGFAVVAEQIGRLAGSTASSVDQIQELLSQSQLAIGEGSRHVESAIPVLGEVFSSVGAIDTAAAQILTEIRAQSASVSSILEKLTQIAHVAGSIETAVREQRSAGREVLTSIEAMSREIQALAHNGDEVAAVGTEMKEGASALNGLVAGFKTE